MRTEPGAQMAVVVTARSQHITRVTASDYFLDVRCASFVPPRSVREFDIVLGQFFGSADGDNVKTAIIRD